MHMRYLHAGFIFVSMQNNEILYSSHIQLMNVLSFKLPKGTFLTLRVHKDSTRVSQLISRVILTLKRIFKLKQMVFQLLLTFLMVSDMVLMISIVVVVLFVNTIQSMRESKTEFKTESAVAKFE